MAEIIMNLPLLPLVVMGAVVAVLLTWVGAHRTHGPARLVLLGLTLGSIGGIVVITFLRVKLPINPLAAFQWQSDGALRFVSDFGSSEEIWLNVLLFVPACFFSTIYTRRPALVAPLGTVTSVLAECSQGAFGTGVPDASDVLANSLGAAFGTLLGCGVLIGPIGYRSRSVVVPASGLIILLLGATACVPVAATIYQTSYERAVAQNLHHISYSKIKAMKASTGPDITHVWQAGYNFADGNEWNTHEAVARYPSSFLFIRQCVIATWRPSGLEVHGARGSVCDQQWV